MSQFNYDDFLKKEQERQEKGNFERGNIQFLSNYLKEDGSSVYVRFPYTSANDFTFYSLHRINVEGVYRNVLCLRNDSDPITNCPLCAKGDKSKDRILVKCIVYVQGEQGIELVPCVWERPAMFAKTLKERLDAFGNAVYKITRMGQKGDKNTSYDVMPTNPQIYNEQAYPVNFSGFDNYKFNNHMFLDRTYDEVTTFITTGKFPERVKANPQDAQPQVAPQVAPQQPQYNNYNNQFTQSPYVQEQPQVQQPQGYNWNNGYNQPVQQQAPTQQPTQQRPVRKY